MTKYSKFNIVYRLQKWMDSVPGQTFLNYAYSWGASVVILGTLFKLTHLPGANFMLFLGMGTEVFVFFISAFDRPFDKTADGRDIPTHFDEEEVEAEAEAAEAAEEVKEAGQQTGAPSVVVVGGGQPAGTQPIFAGGAYAPASASAGEGSGQQAATAHGETTAAGAAQTVAAGVGGMVVTPQPNFVPQMSPEEAQELKDAQGDYVDQLKKLVDTLKLVDEQSARLTRDSEEMENLNRTLTGITKIYEMQLKGASQQVGTIDQINDQTKKMAEQIQQLNNIYARMIEAMTVNMRAAAPGAGMNAGQPQQ